MSRTVGHYNYFIEMSKPTEEDLKRVFTEEELKELCLKHKCKVDIWRWNAVNDYRILFTESGRYQKWSEGFRLHMLAKAVNKMKSAVLYDEVEIRKTRTEEWKLQLKENILSLNFWKRQRLKPKLASIRSHEIDPELQFDVDTESLKTAFEIVPTIYGSNVDLQPQIEVNIESESFAENITTKALVATKKLTQNIGLNIIEAAFDESYVTDNSEDVIEAMLKEKQTEKSREILDTNDVAPEIENIYARNTMSITIDSEMSTQSLDLGTLESQLITPHSYDNFKNIIPMTSTQSQSQGAEEIIV